ncbi:TPA: hypothetical protein N0F65_008265 [Lagenidium giganteum]|uniref:Uncharacterized protein n=1 Tax=Lagenidium giganteum TaxID=4803 RepID=A0AAV2YTY7_9STRA|nr:TPA: hypothetical protein N0F65_008265 [Lagenidium giganteum]
MKKLCCRIKMDPPSADADRHSGELVQNPCTRVERWLAFLSGIAMMLSVGSFYAMSAWNAQLKTYMHYSQEGIVLISSMAIIGSYLTWFGGFVIDRIGVTQTLTVGTIASLAYFPSASSPLRIGLCCLLVGLFGAVYILASYVTLGNVFGHHNRGKVMAALSSAYSCGGALFAFVVQRGFDGNVPGYFAFIGVVLVVIGCIGILLFSFLPRGSAVPRTPSFECADVHAQGDNNQSGTALLSNLEFWLLFVATLVIVGAGLFVVSNVFFIVESLRGDMAQVPWLISLFSFTNTCSRLLTGIASDHVIATWPRGYFAALAALITAFAQVLFLLRRGNSTLPVITREDFGVQHFGKNYGLLNLANAIGSPFVLSPLSSFVYHRHAVPVDGVEKCYGRDCFNPVFLFIIVQCVVAFVCSIKLGRLHHRRHRYQLITDEKASDARYATAKRRSALGAGVALLVGVECLKTYVRHSQEDIPAISSMAVMGSYLSWFPGVVFDRNGVTHALTVGILGLGIVDSLLWAPLEYMPLRVSPWAVGTCCIFPGVFASFYHLARPLTAVVELSIIHRWFDGNVPGFFLFLGVFLVVRGVAAKLTYPTEGVSHDDSEPSIQTKVPSLRCMSPRRNITGWSLLRSYDFWLLFVPVLVVIGVGLFVMSNVSFIVESLGGPRTQVPFMIALFSVGNTSSRLLTGALPDHMIASWPRAYFVAASAVGTALTQHEFFFLPNSWLMLPFVGAGISEGVMFGTFPVIIWGPFGVAHFGKNYTYSMLGFANAIGLPLLLSPFSSAFYHVHASRNHGLENPCFLLIIALCVVAFACCVQLGRRHGHSFAQSHPYQALP